MAATTLPSPCFYAVPHIKRGRSSVTPVAGPVACFWATERCRSNAVTSTTRLHEACSFCFVLLAATNHIKKSRLSSWRDPLRRALGTWKATGGKQRPPSQQLAPPLAIGIRPLWTPKTSSQLHVASGGTQHHMEQKSCHMQPWKHRVIRNKISYFKPLSFRAFCCTVKDNWSRTLRSLTKHCIFYIYIPAPAQTLAYGKH